MKTQFYKISYNPLYALRVRGSYLDWKVVKVVRKFSPYSKFENYFNKGVKKMFNRNVAIACVGLGLFSSVFVAIAGKSLAPESAQTFNFLGLFAVSFGVLFNMLSGKSPEQERYEREDIQRDIDAVYRHIDDRNRDMQNDLDDLRRDCQKSCAAHHCTTGKK